MNIRWKTGLVLGLVSIALFCGFMLNGQKGFRADSLFYVRKTDSLYEASLFETVSMQSEPGGASFSIRHGEEHLNVQMVTNGNSLSWLWEDGLTVNGEWQAETKTLRLNQSFGEFLRQGGDSFQRGICPCLAKIWYGAEESRGQSGLWMFSMIPALLAGLMIILPEKLLTFGWHIHYESRSEPTKTAVRCVEAAGWIILVVSLGFLSCLFLVLGGLL